MYFLKCILCDTPNVTYHAMQECMGKIEFMAKMSTPPLIFWQFKHWKQTQISLSRWRNTVSWPIVKAAVLFRAILRDAWWTGLCQIRWDLVSSKVLNKFVLNFPYVAPFRNQTHTKAKFSHFTAPLIKLRGLAKSLGEYSRESYTLL